VFVTHDGGKTWTEKVMPNDNSDVNAQVAFGPEGAAYFTTLDRNDPSRKLARSKIPIWKSLDGGRTWDGPVLFGRLADHPSLAVDTTTSRFRGRVYLSTNEGNRFSVYRSADGGQTFSEPVSHKHSNTVVTDKIVVLPDGAVLILFKEYTDSANVWEVALCTILSEDGGETFTNRRLVARKISTLHIPPSEGMVTQRGGSGNGDSSAAIDTKGRVHVVWTD
jgi:hypothetical protein